MVTASRKYRFCPSFSNGPNSMRISGSAKVGRVFAVVANRDPNGATKQGGTIRRRYYRRVSRWSMRVYDRPSFITRKSKPTPISHTQSQHIVLTFATNQPEQTRNKEECCLKATVRTLKSPSDTEFNEKFVVIVVKRPMLLAISGRHSSPLGSQ